MLDECPYPIFVPAIYDVIACYAPSGKRGNLPRKPLGQQFRDGVLAKVPKHEWERIKDIKGERILDRMRSDSDRARQAYEAWCKRSKEDPQASGCFQALIGEARYASLAPDHLAAACGEAYGRLLLAEEVPPLPAWITSGDRPPVHSNSHVSRSARSRSLHERSADLEGVPEPPFPEPALDLLAGPSELLYYKFGADRFLRTAYAQRFLGGIDAVLRVHRDKWSHLMTLQGYDGCQSPYSRVEADADELDKAWKSIEGLPAEERYNSSVAFKKMVSVLLPPDLVGRVLRIPGQEMNDNARMLGEAYGAMLKSLASAHVIEASSDESIAFHKGRLVSFAQSLGARRLRPPSPFTPVARDARW